MEKITKLAIIGDFHIPGRAEKIPDEFTNILEKGQFDAILCTGDLTEKYIYDELCKYGTVKCVEGNMDNPFGCEQQMLLTFGKYKIGLVHGKGIYPRGNVEGLEKVAEKLGADILISGHTHNRDIKKVGKKLLINPGSATGVWGGGSEGSVPSFMVLELGEKIKIHTYFIFRGLQEEIEEYKIKEEK
jgi:putative phosphoesterase